MDSLREAIAIGMLEGFPAWATTSFVLLSITFSIAQAYIVYVYGLLLPTLAILEDTSTGANNDPTLVATVEEGTGEVFARYRDSPDAETDDVPPTPSAQEQLLVTTKPTAALTSSARATIKHLEREAGSRLARVRGFRILWLYMFAAQTLGMTLGQIFGGSYVFMVLGMVVGECACAGLNMLWTHTILSKPRSLWFWRRARPGKVTRKILTPQLLWSLSQAASVALIVGLAIALFPHSSTDEKLPLPPPESDEEDHHSLGLFALLVTKLLLLLSVAFSLVFLLPLPAKIILVRCQAALLSADETPLIPFDRTFGDRVRNDGSLSMRDAWRSFDRSGRVRVCKIYLATIARLVLCWTLYGAGTMVIAVLIARTHAE